jgi:hypothetical protein
MEIFVYTGLTWIRYRPLSQGTYHLETRSRNQRTIMTYLNERHNCVMHTESGEVSWQ